MTLAKFSNWIFAPYLMIVGCSSLPLEDEWNETSYRDRPVTVVSDGLATEDQKKSEACSYNDRSLWRAEIDEKSFRRSFRYSDDFRLETVDQEFIQGQSLLDNDIFASYLEKVLTRAYRAGDEDLVRQVRNQQNLLHEYFRRYYDEIFSSSDERLKSDNLIGLKVGYIRELENRIIGSFYSWNLSPTGRSLERVRVDREPRPEITDWQEWVYRSLSPGEGNDPEAVFHGPKGTFVMSNSFVPHLVRYLRVAAIEAESRELLQWLVDEIELAFATSYRRELEPGTKFMGRRVNAMDWPWSESDRNELMTELALIRAQLALMDGEMDGLEAIYLNLHRRSLAMKWVCHRFQSSYADYSAAKIATRLFKDTGKAKHQRNALRYVTGLSTQWSEEYSPLRSNELNCLKERLNALSNEHVPDAYTNSNICKL